MSEQQKYAAAIQMASGPSVSANLLKVDQYVSEAVQGGARLVVLPENFAFMGQHEKDVLSLRETDGDGPLQAYLSQLARQHAIWLVGGTIPMRAESDDRARAACLVYNDRGERVARYDKMHLFDVHLVEAKERYSESGTIEPGSEPVVVDTPFGKLGVTVCYDLRFPELYRKLLDMGMEIICVPAAFTAITGKAHWETLVRARAVENLCYVVAAAQGGFHLNGRETHGHSMIVNPWGVILAEARNTGSIRAAIDLEYLNTTRRNFPAISHRKIHCN